MNRKIVLTAAVLALLATALSVAFYDRLPDPVPTHFDMAGTPNGFTPKPFGAFILPFLIAVLGLILSVLPAISPRGYTLEAFRRVFEIVSITILAVIFVIGIVALLQALGWRPPLDRVIDPLIGVILIVIGNFMGKLRRNFFIGIRTPWTLADEEVWYRTHRFGGPLFVIAGIVLMAAPFFGAGVTFVLPVLLLAALIPVVYSYVIYRRLQP
jgi:uncharacterized membrane protein